MFYRVGRLFKRKNLQQTLYYINEGLLEFETQMDNKLNRQGSNLVY